MGATFFAHVWLQFVTLPVAFGGGADQPCAEPDDKVTVTVVVVLATDKNDKVDPLLECVAREVRKKDDKLTGFRMGTVTRKTLTVGSKETFPLIEDQELHIEAKECSEDPKRVCLKVKAPKMGCVTYTCVCSKFFPLITGYQTKDHDRLIIAVMVKSCPEE